MRASRQTEARIAALREAGERMFQLLIGGGCGHSDPRHPCNYRCEFCKVRAEAMDAWDEALARGGTS